METSPLKITFLGTGTSQGVPVIACDCDVCRSPDPRDKRLRTSVLVNKGKLSIAIDAGPDFRQQMLRAGVKDLSAILLTHQHNDHIIGLDDVRPFNFRHWMDMPIYATPAVQAEIRKRFNYIFEDNPYPGAPRLTFHSISKDAPFQVDGLHILPVEVQHGQLPVLGFKIGDFTYLTDVKTIDEAEKQKIRFSKILVLNALHHNVHETHLNLKEALALIEDLQPQQAYLTHMSHRMGLHQLIDRQLPPNVALAYDGLELIL